MSGKTSDKTAAGAADKLGGVLAELREDWGRYLAFLEETLAKGADAEASSWTTPSGETVHVGGGESAVSYRGSLGGPLDLDLEIEITKGILARIERRTEQ